MEFLLLGPLEARLDGKPLPLGPRRAERCLLGLLLLETGRIVSVDRLGDLLWDNHPPESSRAILQTHVSRLRAVLDPHRDGRHGVSLLGHGSGYELQADPDTVDAFRFRGMVMAAHDEPAPHERASALRQALALWRGPVLADCASDRLRDRIGTGLLELRLDTWESCIEAEIEAGRHRAVIAELTDLVAENPLRERLVYLLMVALHRDGQHTAALDAFQEARKRIAEATGLDPGARLTELQAAILRGDPLAHKAQADPRRPQGRNPPRQLPPDIAHFIGRSAELDQLVAAAGRPRAGFPGVATIHGPGGTGKSALAIRAAHQLSQDFPDAQLYIDLQGATPGIPPLTAREALQRLLRGLGINSREIPHSEAECATAFRDATDGRRVLLLVDNALDAAQVKPLLPASSACFVIVTSRAFLSTVDNAAHIRLESLSEPEAIELLGRFDKRAFMPAERAAAAAIAARCDRLPLAIRVVGARLAARPDRSLSHVVQRLERQRARLNELELDDLSVRASISVSHENLRSDQPGRAAGELLQGVGILDCPDATAPLVVALTRFDGETVAGALARLVEQQLLFAKAHGRFGLHDLVRLYAREQAVAKWSPKVRRRAVHRVLDFYVWNAKRAMDLLFPGSLFSVDHICESPVDDAFSTPAEAHDWIDKELANLLSIAGQAAPLSATHAALVVKLAGLLQYALYDRLARYAELRTLSELAIAAARRAGDLSGQANALHGLGLAMTAQDEPEGGIAALLEALELNRRVPDPVGEAQNHLVLSFAYRRAQRFDDAVHCLRQGIAICVAAGVPRLEANLRDNLGTAYQRIGRLNEAIAAHEHGLRIRREAGTVLGIAASLENLGWALLRAGRTGEAAESFGESVALGAKISNFMLQANALWGLGEAEHRLGHRDAAQRARRDSIDLLRMIGAIEDDEAVSLLAQDAPQIPTAFRKRSE